MEPLAIEQALTSAESALADGRSLRGTGFWPAVARVKTDPELVDRHAHRVAAIDERAFEEWALIRVPVLVGTLIAVTAMVGGFVLIGLAYGLTDLTAVVVFYLGLVALLATTHGLAHLVVGRLVGIRFTSWFIGTITRPQPGVKVDYVSYLKTPASRRAWMHASGAIVTKVVPFALIGAAVAAELPTWAVWGLVAIGTVTVLTDVLWSTTKSDWKKFSREMRFAQSDRSG